MSLSQTQQERDTYDVLETRIERSFSNRVELGRLEAEVTGAAICESDRRALLGRIEQYRIDKDRVEGIGDASA